MQQNEPKEYVSITEYCNENELLSTFSDSSTSQTAE